MVASVLTPSLAWWWEDGLFFFRCGDTQFAFVTKTGTTHVFDLVTGRAEKLTTDLGRAIHKEAVLLARRQLASPEYDERTRGAIMLGVLRDRDSIPTLKRLLADATAKGTQSSGFGPSYPFYDVQAAAGAALAMLLGREAAPLLEARLRGANPEMAQHWTGLLGEIRAAQPKR
jgi:HEAT repeat protein